MRRSWCIVRTSGRRNQNLHCEQIFACNSELEAKRRLRDFRRANPAMKVSLRRWPVSFAESERKEGLVYEEERGRDG
ncbi:hypothetical protein [Rubrobacter calidifluminis]|uniref:hypothetical protein n=1 Tax=Rubrobacter calidifluminis TaxID=1392640 RepID=UPI0023629010|nr:hypothetical protein [Rubrobacter calidifluminis]